MAMYCPYCDVELSEKQLESEDGCCPECGTYIPPEMYRDEDDEDGEFNDSEYEDDIGDSENEDIENEN